MTSVFNASVFIQQASGAIHSKEEREKRPAFILLEHQSILQGVGGFIRYCTLHKNQPVVNDQTLACEAGIDLIQDPGAACSVL